MDYQPLLTVRAEYQRLLSRSPGSHAPLGQWNKIFQIRLLFAGKSDHCMSCSDV